MQIIPVIDLKDGIVVHARQGNRDHYAPIKSTLCPSANIFDVINVFWNDFGFVTLYIADLNAITQTGNNHDLLAEVLTTFNHLTFWIDSGYPLPHDFLHTFDNYQPILGTESLANEDLPALERFNKNFILSLDFSIGELGASNLFSKQELWPQQIIIMNLLKVGSKQGPDIEKLAAYQKAYPEHHFICAGGVRDLEDLNMLESIGINQALVATALHNGKLNRMTIQSLRAKKYPDEAGYF